MYQAIDRLQTLRVEDVMAREVVQIPSDQTIDEAAHLFAEQDISSAPVADHRGMCVGMLSRADIVKLQASGGDLSQPVTAVMTKEVQYIGPHVLLMQAARSMCDDHIHRLPVIQDDRIVGVVSTMDIVASVVNALDERAAQEA